MDLISIIVPIYNVENYLEDCINSILNQSYKNFEIILIDDGSTDDSKNICDKYSKMDKRIIVIHKKNGGLSDARNCGVKKACGQFITFVDGDDTIDKNYVEYLYKSLIEYNADFSWCSFFYKKDKNQEVKESGKYHSLLLNGNEFYNKYSFENGGVNSTAKLFRKEIFKKITFREGKYHEDVFFYNDLLKNNLTKVAYLTNKLYIYRIHSGSITKTKMNDKRHFDLIDGNFELLSTIIKLKYNYDMVEHLLDNINLFIFHRRWKKVNYKYLLKKIRKFSYLTLRYDKRRIKKIKYLIALIIPLFYIPFVPKYR